MMTPTDTNNFVEAAKREVLVRYFLVATSTVLLLDYFFTFPQEVRLVWRARRSFAQMIYLGARYTSFAIALPLIMRFLHWPNQPLCLAMNVLTIWSGWISYALGEIIFSLRTCAIWEWSRPIVILLAISYTVSMGAQFAINSLITHVVFSNPNIGITSCYIGGSDHTLTYTSLACLLFFETIVVCLTIIRALYHLPGLESSRAPLLVTLYRDGLLFYVYTAAISLANILVVALAPGAYLGLVFSLQRALHSILAVRVMLHLREVRAEDDSRQSGISAVNFMEEMAGIAMIRTIPVLDQQEVEAHMPWPPSTSGENR